MNLLNLDELAPVLKTVVFKGVKHEIKELGVGAFLEAYAQSKTLGTKDDVAANLEDTITQIRRVIPSLPEAELREMSFEQLFTLVRFVNGTLEASKEAGEKVVQKGVESGN